MGCTLPLTGDGPRSPSPLGSPIRVELTTSAGPQIPATKATHRPCRCRLRPMDLTAVLQRAVESGASDIHCKIGQPPVFRHDGELVPSSDFPPLDDVELEAILDAVTAATPRRRETFDEIGELDIAYSMPGLPRFRVNGFRQRGAISFAF